MVAAAAERCRCRWTSRAPTLLDRRRPILEARYADSDGLRQRLMAASLARAYAMAAMARFAARPRGAPAWTMQASAQSAHSGKDGRIRPFTEWLSRCGNLRCRRRTMAALFPPWSDTGESLLSQECRTLWLASLPNNGSHAVANASWQAARYPATTRPTAAKTTPPRRCASSSARRAPPARHSFRA
jgi:hypothetical protein